MFQVTINEKGGQGRQESFDKAEITIGRVQGNDIILPKGNISKRHSRIVLKDGKFIIVDLKSTNGTYVNGKKITAPQVVKSSDKIYIGDFTLQLAGQNGASAEAREVSLRARSPVKNDEIDLFGGDAPMGLDDAAPAADPEPAAPALIDDNFDQEFDAPPAEPQSGLPRLSKPAPLEPEPEENPRDHELEAIIEPEPEPKPSGLPRAQMAPARSGASRVRPIPARAKAEADEEPAAGVLIPDAPADLAPAEPPLGVPTLRPNDADEGAPVELAPAPAVVPAAPVPAVVAGASELLPRADALNDLHLEVAESLSLRGRMLAELPGLETHAVNEARSAADRMVAAGLLSQAEDLQILAEEVAARATGIEPLLDLLEDQQVVEIAINHDRQVLADRDGRLEPVDRRLASEAQVVQLIQTLAVLAGAEPDQGLIDGRLRDGTRVVAALPPLSFRGPTVSLRKTTRDFFTLDKLLEYNTISPEMMTFLDHCVRCRTNLLLSVGPGVNATATLNALLAQMPTDDRVVTIERGVELHVLPPRNLVTLEPQGGIPLSSLLAHAVSLQADRAVLGDVSGLDLTAALRTIEGPLQGSVLVYPASSPAEVIEKMAAAVSEDEGLSIDAARALVVRSIPVVLHEARFLDNSRRITVVSEVLIEDGEIRLEDIFTFKAEGVDENLIVTGTFHATGYTPKFLQNLVDRGEAQVDMDIFKV